MYIGLFPSARQQDLNFNDIFKKVGSSYTDTRRGFINNFMDFPKIIKVWLICRNAVRAMNLAISIIYFNLRLWILRHDVMFNSFSAIEYL